MFKATGSTIKYNRQYIKVQSYNPQYSYQDLIHTLHDYFHTSFNTHSKTSQLNVASLRYLIIHTHTYCFNGHLPGEPG